MIGHNPGGKALRGFPFPALSTGDSGHWDGDQPLRPGRTAHTAIVTALSTGVLEAGEIAESGKPPLKVENSQRKEYNHTTESQQDKGQKPKLGLGVYTDTIRWPNTQIVRVRPDGKGFWGERVKQNDERVDQYELQINPNNESYYLPYPSGGYVQFENMVHGTVQDGKLVIAQRSFYHVYDMPGFAASRAIKQGQRQLDAAKMAGYTVEWLVSEKRAAEQLQRLFQEHGMDIKITYYPEQE